MDVLFTANDGFEPYLVEMWVLDTFLCGAQDDSECRECHPSCTTAGICDACLAGAATTESTDGAYCLCNNPINWELENYHEFCCDSSCPLCVGTTVAAYMTHQDQVGFVNSVAAPFQLPLLDETDVVFCYPTFP